MKIPSIELGNISRFRAEQMGAAMLFVILFHVALDRGDPFYGLRRCGNVGVDIFLFLSGVSWPQSNIPPFWRAFGCLFPSTFGIQGFVKMNTMGALITDIAYECKALWIQAILYGLLAFWLLCRTSRQFINSK